MPNPIRDDHDETRKFTSHQKLEALLLIFVIFEFTVSCGDGLHSIESVSKICWRFFFENVCSFKYLYVDPKRTMNFSAKFLMCED